MFTETQVLTKTPRYRLRRPRRRDEYLLQNRLRLVHGGREFFQQLRKLIGQAQHCIHFQTYIFEEDEAGELVTGALIEAAQRNVEVYLLVDGYASQRLSRAFRQKLKEAGVRFRYFQPLLRSRHFYFGRRLHHKVVVVDGTYALVGSMNVSNRYFDPPEEEAWFDVALYVEGEVALELNRICWQFWTRRKRRRKALPEECLRYPASIPTTERVPARVRQNDWVNRKQQVYRTYRSMIRQAEKSLSIVCSYFIPDKNLLQELKRAVRRGVEVKVVLAGFSDVKIAKAAERYLYRYLLRNGIKVYEYQPSVLHAKFAVMDREWVTIGSFNVNNMSAYASIELNVDVRHREFGEQVHEEIEKLIQRDCEQAALETYNSRLFSLRQLIRWTSFQVLRIVLKLTTFYWRQRE